MVFVDFRRLGAGSATFCYLRLPEAWVFFDSRCLGKGKRREEKSRGEKLGEGKWREGNGNFLQGLSAMLCMAPKASIPSTTGDR